MNGLRRLADLRATGCLGQNARAVAVAEAGASAHLSFDPSAGAQARL
jgi:hypothetical protein